MRLLLLSLLLSSLTPSLSFAQESSCAQAYRQDYEKFLTTIEDLKSTESNLSYGGLAGATGVGACLVATKSVIGCVGLLGPFLAGSQAYRYYVSREIKELEESYKVYQVYAEISREDYASEPVQALLVDLSARTSQEYVVVKEFSRLMDSGELCEGGHPAKSLDEITLLLRQRLTQP